MVRLRHVRRNPGGHRPSALAGRLPLCSCIVRRFVKPGAPLNATRGFRHLPPNRGRVLQKLGADQPLVPAKLSVMRSLQAPATFRLSQDLTTAQHFRRSQKADFSKVSTFTTTDASSLCSCIVGTDQPLVPAELSAMRSPQTVPILYESTKRPGSPFPRLGKCRSVVDSYKTSRPRRPRRPRRPAECTSRPKASSAASRRRGRTARGPVRC